MSATKPTLAVLPVRTELMKPGERRLRVGYTVVEFKGGPKDSEGAVFVTPAATENDLPMVTVEHDGVRHDISMLDIATMLVERDAAAAKIAEALQALNEALGATNGSKR